MAYKLIDTREKHTMTKRQEEAVVQAFERFQPEGTHIKLPQREHLAREFRASVCCEHKWLQVDITEEMKKFLQMTFEETDLGNQQLKCLTCGALSLWESGELFAYDAIATTEKQENTKQRRERK